VQAKNHLENHLTFFVWQDRFETMKLFACVILEDSIVNVTRGAITKTR